MRRNQSLAALLMILSLFAGVSYAQNSSVDLPSDPLVDRALFDQWLTQQLINDTLNEPSQAFVEVEAEDYPGLSLSIDGQSSRIWSRQTRTIMFSPEEELRYILSVNYPNQGWGRPNEGQLISVSTSDIDDLD